MGDERAELASLIEHHVEKDLLRFTTAGSVDDGKSTLIGRLLHDSKAVYEDQLESVRKSRINRSSGPMDFSLLTDGLRAEREQGITIDVAYRYFETPRRKFIIADSPGHEQYTRNMATGASTADLAVILIDATRGVLAQTRRHAYIASLLGIGNVVAAINKMDLLDFEEAAFRRIEYEFAELAGQLKFDEVVSIPISALAGDNVVTRSTRMPWHDGPALLEHLETVPVCRASGRQAVRFPVQYVIRPDARFRGFAGQLASGSIRPGDALVALPSEQKSRVRSIATRDGELARAFAPMSVTITLEDEIDLSRGDLLVSEQDLPHISRNIEAMVVWFDAQPMELGRTYLVKHAVRGARVKATAIEFRVEMETLERRPAQELEMNDVAAVRFEASSPLFFDAYAENRITGSFILIDPISNATVGAAMIRKAAAGAPESVLSQATSAESGREWLSGKERYRRHGHLPALIWVKHRPVLAPLLERALFEQGFEAVHMTQGDLAADHLGAALRLAQTSGLVLVYSADAAETKLKSCREAAPGLRIFDIASMGLPGGDQAAVEAIVSAVQSLRINGDTTESREAT
jgi:sulfate adenylyltransferase large subunit